VVVYKIIFVYHIIIKNYDSLQYQFCFCRFIFCVLQAVLRCTQRFSQKTVAAKPQKKGAKTRLCRVKNKLFFGLVWSAPALWSALGEAVNVFL